MTYHSADHTLTDSNHRPVTKLLSALISIALSLCIAGCQKPAVPVEETTKTLTILATSDIHGKLWPWNYELDTDATAGSCAQLKTAIQKLYNPDTCLLVDAGDTIQGTHAYLFLDETPNPMVRALNELGYEVETTGNHEYNYGMDILNNAISAFHRHEIVGNVVHENGEPIAERWAIIEKNGIRIAVISMVTPNITMWDSTNLKGYKVLDPISETEKILQEIEGQYDVLIGVNHMSIPLEYDVHGSGAEEYAEHFPQFDLIVASHEHMLEEGTEVNGVLIVENKAYAQTMIKADLTLEKTESGWEVTSRKSEAIMMSDYEPDPEFLEEYKPYHEAVLAEIRKEIGTLTGDSGLLLPSETDCIPGSLIENAPLINFYHDAKAYFTNADITASCILDIYADLEPGPIMMKDLSEIYRFENNLCLVSLNGAQLRKCMEWSASFYNTVNPEDLTLSFDRTRYIYNFDFFRGVNYEIDVSKPAGERIVTLTKPDGTPVKDDDVFTLAVNDYRYETHFSDYGPIFSEADGLPELIDGNVRSEIGGMADLLAYYVIHGLNGTIVPDYSQNWKLVGIEWDPALHQKAIDLINDGTIQMDLSPVNHSATVPVAVSDLEGH